LHVARLATFFAPKIALAMICCAIILASVLVSTVSPAATDSPDYTILLDHIDAERAWNIVNDLAGDDFEGRRAGTAGANLASEYVASYFGSIGLRPAGENGGYRTRFTLPLWQLTQMPALEMLDHGGNVLQAFDYRRDFNVIPGSGSGDYSAEVVFAGYGITAGSLGYDDFDGLSVGGKIVLAIVGTPRSGGFRESNYGAAYVKAENALRHGAVGLILVDNPAEPTSHYIERSRCGACWTNYGRLTLQGSSVGMADRLLRDSDLTLSSLQQEIDQKLRPRSFALGKQLHISVRASFVENADSYNVLGFIPGTDPDASRKVVIIGAHYDHWGKDVNGDVFRGANDDASGVAVMMEIARLFSVATKPKWSILFASWSGEEEGFYGSYAYVQDPYFPVSGTIAYLNLDMVGYGQPLIGESSKTHTALRAVMDESANQLGISLVMQDFQGGSGHASFENKGVPNLMLIYWPDDAYHTPADTATHVSKKNLFDAARLTALIALKLGEIEVTGAALTTSHSITVTRRIETSGTSLQLGGGVLRMDFLVIAGVVIAVVLVPIAFFHFRGRKRDNPGS